MHAYHLYHNHLSIYLSILFLFVLWSLFGSKIYYHRRGVLLLSSFLSNVLVYIWYICTGTRFWESIYLCFTIRSPEVLTGTSAY